MRVFDLLQKRPGLEGAEVARALEASLKGTLCLLEACVSLGLLERKQGGPSSLSTYMLYANVFDFTM